MNSDIDALVDDSKDINIWFASIDPTTENGQYEATINIRLRKPAKVIEFRLAHSPNIYLDSIDNAYTSIFYGGADSLINDISIYNISELNVGQLV